MTRVIAMLPTYNEAENIAPLIDAILELGAEYEALIVDDDSPDGTWRVVAEKIKAERAAANPAQDPTAPFRHRIHLLHRTRDRGRGLAGLAGFREAVRLGADYVIEMDADWSHDPKWIPALYDRAHRPIDPVDVVVGSRLITGGGEVGRHPARGFITRAANAYIRTMVGLPVHDATSGFRLFSRRCLTALPWGAMRATGPEVVQEVLLAAYARGFKIAEVPIVFVERRHGQSTFNARIMLRSLVAMARLRFKPGELVPRPPDGEDETDAAGQSTRGHDDEALLARLPTAAAIPLSLLWRGGRALDRALHITGALPRRQLAVPVVCVGNLTVGGTGKTPMVRHLAETLQAEGLRAAVLSRGYGAVQKPKRPLLVGDGQRLVASPEDAGDEPALLATLLEGIPVIAHPSRYLAGRMAMKMFGSNVLILDDGFQHDSLARDFDVVLWDVRDVPSRMRMLPAGRLREPVSALRRAGAVVLTHAEYLPADEREARVHEVTVALKRAAPNVALFEAETRAAHWRWLSGGPIPESVGQASISALGDAPLEPGARIVAVSGLARPAGFESMLHELGLEVVEHLKYADHHAYAGEEIVHWGDLRQQTGAVAVVTTEKDAIKLGGRYLGRLPLAALRIEMRITEPARWLALLRRALR